MRRYKGQNFKRSKLFGSVGQKILLPNTKKVGNDILSPHFFAYDVQKNCILLFQQSFFTDLDLLSYGALVWFEPVSNTAQDAIK